MRKHSFIVASMALSMMAAGAQAVSITLDKNGFPNLSGGQVTGPSTGGFTTTQLGANGNPVTINNLQPNTTYSIDFFHNSSAGGSDFSFTINAAGTGVQSVSLGGGVHTMVTGFTPGATTLTLNTHTITYNANTGQKGNYYVPGVIANGSTGNNSPPKTVTVIPGSYSVDNLYNSGLGNEDYAFRVDSNGNTGPSPLTSGTAAIPHSEYADFDGANVNPRSRMVHYIIETTAPMAFPLADYPILNSVISNGGKHFEFDLIQTVGNAGINLYGIVNLQPHTVSETNLITPGGTLQGNGTGDFLFRPRLRYNGTSPYGGFYFDNANGAGYGEVFAIVTGPNESVAGNPPVTATIRAIIPEPASAALLGAGVTALLARRRRA